MKTLYNECQDVCSSCGGQIKTNALYQFGHPVCKACNGLVQELRDEKFNAHDIYASLFVKNTEQIELI
jgi:hypothetical protein